jgi:hypothetical protein
MSESVGDARTLEPNPVHLGADLQRQGVSMEHQDVCFCCRLPVLGMEPRALIHAKQALCQQSISPAQGSLFEYAQAPVPHT